MLILSQQRLIRFYRLFFILALFFGGLTTVFAAEVHFKGNNIRIDLHSNDGKAFSGQFQFDGHSYLSTATMVTPSKIEGKFTKDQKTYPYTVLETNGNLQLLIANQSYPLTYSNGGGGTQPPQQQPPQQQPPQQQPPQQQPPQQQPPQQQPPQQQPPSGSVPNGWKTANKYGYSFSYPANWELEEKSQALLLVPSNNGNDELLVILNSQVNGFSQGTTEQQLAFLQKALAQLLGIEAVQTSGQPQSFNAPVGQSVKSEYLYKNTAGNGIARLIYTFNQQDNVFILVDMVNKSNTVNLDANKQTVLQIWKTIRRGNSTGQNQQATNPNRDPKVVGEWCGERVSSVPATGTYISSTFCYTFNADGTYEYKRTTLVNGNVVDSGNRITDNVNSISDNNLTGHWATKGDILYLENAKKNREITYSYFVHTSGIPNLRWGTKAPYTYLEKQTKVFNAEQTQFIRKKLPGLRLSNDLIPKSD